VRVRFLSQFSVSLRPLWHTFKDMPQLTLAGAQLHYEVRGEGEPLVLIPGFAAGAWIWFKQVGALSAHFQVITFDPCGIGQSDCSGALPDMRVLADYVARLLRGLGIARTHILGASFGGFVAQEFALAYPDMTRTLTLCCTSFGGPNHVPPSTETLMALTSTDGFNTESRVRRNLMPAFSPEVARDHSTKVEQTVKLRMANLVSEEAYRAQLMAALGFNAEAELPAIKSPTLIISGDADAIVPVQNSRNLAANIPHAQLRIITGGSHLFFIERPQEFNRIIIEFLKQN
jgi:pimeloyl-ACP methyl ester carboxylesterase